MRKNLLLIVVNVTVVLLLSIAHSRDRTALASRRPLR